MSKSNLFPSFGQFFDDEKLIECARRDPEAFAKLYDHYYPAIYRYFFSKVSNPNDAEDLTSQLFLTVLEILPRYHHVGNFRAWLFGIARRKTADYYRNKVHQISIDTVKDLADPGVSLLVQIARTEQLKLVAQHISELPSDEQELLRLRFAARLNFAEIAEVLTKKETAVKMALYRLLERLEVQMENERYE